VERGDEITAIRGSVDSEKTEMDGYGDRHRHRSCSRRKFEKWESDAAGWKRATHLQGILACYVPTGRMTLGVDAETTLGEIGQMGEHWTQYQKDRKESGHLIRCRCWKVSRQSRWWNVLGNGAMTKHDGK
jgi:hypothetical protein